MKSRWSIPALGAFFVAVALLVSACGSSGVPSNAVATVAGNPISKQAYDHWLFILFKGQSAQDPTEPVIVPNNPPQFSSCVAELRSGIPSLAKKPDSTLRGYCSAAFAKYSPEILDYLIKAYWYQAYAHKLGISITNAQVSKELIKKRGTQLKSASAYEAFLKQAGYTNEDLLWQTRFEMLNQDLAKKFTSKITSAQVAAYYQKHSATFGTPQTRSLRIVLAKTAATANTALAALKHGQSWKTVAKKYSTDTTTKDNGGLLTDISKGQEDAALSNAAFAAPTNKLEGPVKGDFGYYVFEVIKVTPATHQPLSKAAPEIKQTLESAQQTAVTNKITAKTKALYGSRTLCAKAYSMADCHGYKKPKTTATTPATSTPSSGTTPSSTTSSTTSSSTTSSSTTSSSTTSSSTSK